MHVQKSALHVLASLFEGVDARRVALAAGVLVLLVLAWRRVRDVLVMAIVFGALFLARLGDGEAPAPITAEPAPSSARIVIQA